MPLSLVGMVDPAGINANSQGCHISDTFCVVSSMLSFCSWGMVFDVKCHSGQFFVAQSIMYCSIALALLALHPFIYKKTHTLVYGEFLVCVWV
jgi:hypothetical protein